MVDELAGWCERQEAVLKLQLEELRSGRMRVWEQRGSGPGMTDTTADLLDRTRDALNELETILARGRR